jgi:uncharacterized protein (TIGR04255 family)
MNLLQPLHCLYCEKCGLNKRPCSDECQNSMRPKNLPEFGNPPLNEVALGVQFTPAPKYSQIYSRDVWKLFEGGYPIVQEQGPLPPMFETFGFPSQPSIQFGLGNNAQHDRFWFIAPENNKLIQFQPDRLHLNWRKVPDNGEVYPRFDNMVLEFEANFISLQKLMVDFGAPSLTCNQVELAYINHIPMEGESGALKPTDFIKLKSAQIDNANDFNIIYRRVLYDSDQKPKGRLTVECITALDAKASSILVLNLTVRGQPKQPTVSGSIEFLNDARNIIVNEFDSISTQNAHILWNKVTS